MQFNSTIRLRDRAAGAGRHWLAAVAMLFSAGCLDPVNETVSDAGGPDLNSSFNGSDQIGGFDVGQIGTDAAGVDSAGDGLDADTAPDQGLTDGAIDGAGDTTATDAAIAVDGAGDTTAVSDAVGCGDGKCNGPAGESCMNCSADCGACPPFCGNQQCDSNETCSSCAQDCGACPAPVCSVLTSKECGEGKQCFPDGKSNLCYPAGSKVHGNTCAAANECVVGALCVANQCRSLCDWSSAKPTITCQPGVPCEKLVFDGAGDVGQGIGVCKPAAACDPLSDIGCPGGQKCNPSGWFKACAEPGSGAVGSLCAASSQCQTGLLCLESVAGSGTCRPRCHTGGSHPACQAGTCTAILDSNGKPIPGSVGACGA